MNIIKEIEALNLSGITIAPQAAFNSGIGDGWRGIVLGLTKSLGTLADVRIQINQIKEKFGTLRYYITILEAPNNDTIDWIWDRISTVEALSEYICEKTGQPGKLRQDVGWCRTLCDSEYNKQKELP